MDKYLSQLRQLRDKLSESNDHHYLHNTQCQLFNIKNYNFIDRQTLIDTYPKYASTFEGLTDEQINVLEWDIRNREIDATIEQLSKFYDIECIGTAGRSGGYLVIKCDYSDDELDEIIDEYANARTFDDMGYETYVQDEKQLVAVIEYLNNFFETCERVAECLSEAKLVQLFEHYYDYLFCETLEDMQTRLVQEGLVTQ